MTTRTYTDERRSQKWIQFTINVTIKHISIFGIKYERLGEFVFCAQSAADARAIAGPFTAGARGTISTTRMVQIVDAFSVSREVFPMEHAPLKSLSEVASELEEMEFA